MDSTSSTYQQLDEEWQALIAQAEAEPWGTGWPAFIDLEQSFAWIQERTVSAMRAVEIYNCSFDKAVPGACDFMLGGIGKRELVDACVGGVDGLMFGRANGQGDLDNVPSSAWVDSRLAVEETGYVLGPLKTYERHRTRWSGLRVATARLMELWPSELTNGYATDCADSNAIATDKGLTGKNVIDKPVVDAIAQLLRDQPALDVSKAIRETTKGKLPDWELSSITLESYHSRLRRLFKMLYDTGGLPLR